MTLPSQLNTKQSQSYVSLGEGKTAIRTSIYDSDGNELTINSENRLEVAIVDSELYNSLEFKQTTITTSATQISTPDSARNFSIFHTTDNATVYIGNSDVDATGVYIELEKGDVIEFNNMNDDDGNEIYGIVASGTVAVNVAGQIKE